MNIIRGTTISSIIRANLKNEEFYNEFIKYVINQSKEIDIGIIEDFHEYFFRNMVHGDHKYESSFIEKNVDNLTSLIKKGKRLFRDMHMVAGVSCSQIPFSFNFEEITIKVERPEVKDFVKFSKELKLPLQQFSCWIFFQTTEGKSKYWIDQNLLMRPFRLYKLGSVFTLGSIRETFQGKTGGRIIIQHHQRNYYNYKLSKKDSKPLEKFYNQTFPLLYELNNLKFAKKKKEADIIKYSLQVAIERYEEIILEFKNHQDKRIAFAIMGMEALYNLDSDKETIGFKLKIRTAKVLGFFGLNSLEVAKTISKSYGIRSSYAHGSATSKDVSFDFEENIIELLRISILIFLKVEISKSKFIQLLNESFYSKEKERELIKILKVVKQNIILNINKEICP